ncbi:MAG: hypothetical protein Alpg2KO_25640 [Alphaproteobacteria bacterium]
MQQQERASLLQQHLIRLHGPFLCGVPRDMVAVNAGSQTCDPDCKGDSNGDMQQRYRRQQPVLHQIGKRHAHHKCHAKRPKDGGGLQ